MSNRKSMSIVVLALALALSVGLGACSNDEVRSNDADQDDDQLELVDNAENETDADPSKEVDGDDAVDIDETTDKPVDQVDLTMPEEGAALDDVVQTVAVDQSALSETQRNSMAMLNYLAVVTESINSSKNSRLKLEETYSTLINNTYPNAVDDRTLAQLESLLDTINQYRMVDVKRDRLQYIYEQNQAQAIRSAIPNPLGLLSAVESGSLAKLATSVIYMAVDSYTSYQSATASADLEYLKGGWELDDDEADILHERRKSTFSFMVKTVSEHNLPGYLALNEESVEQLVEWSENDNVIRRILFLESNQDTYKAYGGYWLILARSYYENNDYAKCLSAISTYETMRSGILRKDYEYAKTIPMAIVAASETMDDGAYVSYAEERLSQIAANCDNTDWELLYFAAQTYVDLYRRTGNESFLKKSYDIALDNVNVLVGKQEELNSKYLSTIVDARVPKGATKQQKKEIDQYNKLQKESRKKALPPTYQPLLVNCDLLFALADELDVSESERTRIDGILHPNGSDAFLTKPIDDQYRFDGSDEEDQPVKMEFDGSKLTLPANLVSSETAISASKSTGKKALSGDWVVSKVDRGSSKDVSTFTAVFENKEIDKKSYKNGDVVTFTFTDGSGEAAVTRTIKFKASVDENWGFIPNKVEFEQVD